MKIAENKFLYIQAFAYKGFDEKQKSKLTTVFHSVVDLIPIVSSYRNYEKYKNMKCMHKKWAENKSTYMYDARFSQANQCKYLVNAIGLGLLLIPLKIMATALHGYDKKKGKEFNNPHFLNAAEIDKAKSLNQYRESDYKKLTKGRQNDKEFKQIIHDEVFTDHTKNPHRIKKCLFQEQDSKHNQYQTTDFKNITWKKTHDNKYTKK